MSLVYTGRIDKLEIGLTAGTNTDIANVILANWDRSHDVRPRLFANSKVPTDYNQPHSWIVGSVSLLSDDRSFYDVDVQAVAGNQFALVPNGDSNVIDWFAIFYQDRDGTQYRTRFFDAIVYRPVKELLNYDDSVWIYHFLAGYAEDEEV
jgi:hypothetical protein